MLGIRRREFTTLLGGATAWPLTARAQQPALPVIAFISGSSREMGVERATMFRKGLGETGFLEGQNVAVEYHWLDGRYDQLPSLIADLVRRRVAVIAVPGNSPGALAAKAATSTTPIVFAVAENPVNLGLVASLARPGGNATGFNFFLSEINAKRLALLHEFVPSAVRIGVLLNPANPATADSAVRELSEAAPKLGLQIQVLNASTDGEIEATFATFARRPADALFVGNDAFFDSRRVQLAILEARHGLPASHSNRSGVEVGSLMSYGTDVLDIYRLVAVYAGRILKGEKPADLPVMQSSKFELAINLATARALGLPVPASLLAIADEIIE
jgi:putative ABC transport system substrate-binding protein